MAAIDLEHARAQLAAWLEASLALARGASHALDGRSLTRADAAEVERMLNYWRRMEAELLRARRGGPALGAAKAAFGPR